MINIQDALIAQALEEERNKITMPQASTLGALAALPLGILTGNTAHQAGRVMNKVTGRTPKPWRMGHRFAGPAIFSAAGAVTGGAMQNALNQTYEPARLAAKIATNPQALTYADKIAIQNELAKIFSNPQTMASMGVV